MDPISVVLGALGGFLFGQGGFLGNGGEEVTGQVGDKLALDLSNQLPDMWHFFFGLGFFTLAAVLILAIFVGTMFWRHRSAVERQIDRVERKVEDEANEIKANENRIFDKVIGELWETERLRDWIGSLVPLTKEKAKKIE